MKNMKILAIDTSSEQGMVALLEDLKLLGVRLFGRQANPLMNEMETLFRDLQTQVNTVDCIVVGVGPGSYTGIRIGAMVAKTLSFAGRIPLVGISSLLAWMPQESGLEIGRFAVVVDAKVGGFYMLLGEVKEDGRVTHGEPIVCPLQEAIDPLMKVIHIHTPHQALIQQRLKSMVPQIDIDLTRWQWHEHPPSPYVMAKCAINKMHETNEGHTEHEMNEEQFSRKGELSLLYLRKTQAEIERENKGC